ncbi:MAG: metallophosphoesterase [Ruminococcus sp.]|nr:metallophosphoesterase [Ruminococcus sp.]
MLRENLRIVFISDLHNCFYGGKSQKKIYKKIEDFNPDIVLFGGDVIDEYGSTENALTLMKKVSQKYPCAYSAGNHECSRDDIKSFYEDVKSLDIKVLDGDFCDFTVKNQKVRVYGIVNYFSNECDFDSDYNILLMHQPEKFEPYNYDLTKFDLILSGHAHGGQWRLPFVLEQGLFAPNQGFFPQYTNGKYEWGKCTHIISKGLARPLRMIFIPRIFNRPELSLIEIAK